MQSSNSVKNNSEVPQLFWWPNEWMNLSMWLVSSCHIWSDALMLLFMCTYLEECLFLQSTFRYRCSEMFRYVSLLFWRYVSFCFTVSFFPPCYLKEDLWYFLELEECFSQMQHVHTLKPRGILCGTKDKDHHFFLKIQCVSMSVWVVGEQEGEKERQREREREKVNDSATTKLERGKK